MKTSLLLLAGLSLTTTLAFAAEEAGFVPLFNGKDTTGWHLRRKDGHNSWSVENGILKNTVNPAEHGTDLVGDKSFWNFTVKYDFMVPDNSNSGFYLRGRYEVQIDTLVIAKASQTFTATAPSMGSRPRMNLPPSLAANGRAPKRRSSATRSPSS